MAGMSFSSAKANLTTLETRKFDYLTDMKLFFFKRAETLGTDAGSADFIITHGNKAEDEPLYSLIETPATNLSHAESHGDHNIARADRMLIDGLSGILVFEAMVRVEQLTNFAIGLGMGRVISGAETTFRAATFWHDTSIGANWRACSCDGVDHDMNTDTGVAVDTSWHVFRIVVSADTKFYIDGDLKATHAAGYTPNAGLADWIYRTFVQVKTLEDVLKRCRYSYVAVWNEPQA